MISFASAATTSKAVDLNTFACVWQNEMQRERNIEIISDYSTALLVTVKTAGTAIKRVELGFI